MFSMAPCPEFNKNNPFPFYLSATPTSMDFLALEDPIIFLSHFQLTDVIHSLALTTWNKLVLRKKFINIAN